MPKRGRDGDVATQFAPGTTPYGAKRYRALSGTFASDSEPFVCSKRRASFDTEIHRMNKRLRATIPTAEEAIAFLLPHISKLSQLYKESLAENQRLKDNLSTLAQAYEKTKTQNNAMHEVAINATRQVASLKRELEMVKYRFAYFHKQKTLNP